ncbi:hypothetical protein QTP86_002841, partial [Hemibagrus guttatus]
WSEEIIPEVEELDSKGSLLLRNIRVTSPSFRSRGLGQWSEENNPEGTRAMMIKRSRVLVEIADHWQQEADHGQDSLHLLAVIISVKADESERGKQWIVDEWSDKESLGCSGQTHSNLHKSKESRSFPRAWRVERVINGSGNSRPGRYRGHGIGVCLLGMERYMRVWLRELGSEHRGSYDAAPLEQRGLRVLLSSGSMAELGLEPGSSDQQPRACTNNAAMVLRVKVTSPWMAGPKVSQQNIAQSMRLPPPARLLPIVHAGAMCFPGTLLHLASPDSTEDIIIIIIINIINAPLPPKDAVIVPAPVSTAAGPDPVQSNGECGKEVKKRVQAGWNGWRKVWGVLCDQKISVRIKGKVYRTVVRQAMLYGLETVSLRKRQESELEVAELKMLRFSLGVTRLDRIRNEYIRGTAHVGCLGTELERPD